MQKISESEIEIARKMAARAHGVTVEQYAAAREIKTKRARTILGRVKGAKFTRIGKGKENRTKVYKFDGKSKS